MCGNRYRVKTLTEATEAGLVQDQFRAEFFSEYGNKILEDVRLTTGWTGDEYYVAQVNDEIVYVTLDAVVKMPNHAFPNTGMNRSWCSCCGAVGHWDWTKQEYAE